MALRLDYQAAAPAGMRAFGGVHGYVAGCGLPKALIDLVYLRTSQINGCTYCIAEHGGDLLKAGTDPRKLLLLSSWREAGGWFSEQEQAALEWTEAVTLVAATHVPDAAFERVRAQFDGRALADLTFAIALMNAYNRIAIAFRHGPAAP